MQLKFSSYETFSTEYTAVLYAAELDANGYATKVSRNGNTDQWLVEVWECNDADKD